MAITMKPSPDDKQRLEDALDEVLRLQAAVDAAPQCADTMMALIVGMARVSDLMEGIAINAMMPPPAVH